VPSFFVIGAIYKENMTIFFRDCEVFWDQKIFSTIYVVNHQSIFFYCADESFNVLHAKNSIINARHKICDATWFWKIWRVFK